MGKPFIIILNTKYPDKPETEELRLYLEDQYHAPVVAVNCISLTEKEIMEIMKQVLLTFPVREIHIDLPKWIGALNDSHKTKKNIYDAILDSVENIATLSNLKSVAEIMRKCEFIEDVEIVNINLGTGSAMMRISTPKNLFYKIVKETSGFDIDGEDKLLSLLINMSEIKHEYDKVAIALKEVENKGYGIVTPTIDEMSLEEPEIVRQGSRFGVKLKASAPSIHMIKAEIHTEVSPIVGTEKQSEELVHYLLREFESDPKQIWQSNIFGKSLHELVNEGLHNKLSRMPDEAQIKLQETLQKIINEGSGGLICIIL